MRTGWEGRRTKDVGVELWDAVVVEHSLRDLVIIIGAVPPRLLHRGTVVKVVLRRPLGVHEFVVVCFPFREVLFWWRDIRALQMIPHAGAASQHE